MNTLLKDFPSYILYYVKQCAHICRSHLIHCHGRYWFVFVSIWTWREGMRSSSAEAATTRASLFGDRVLWGKVLDQKICGYTVSMDAYVKPLMQIEIDNTACPNGSSEFLLLAEHLRSIAWVNNWGLWTLTQLSRYFCGRWRGLATYLHGAPAWVDVDENLVYDLQDCCPLRWILCSLWRWLEEN